MTTDAGELRRKRRSSRFRAVRKLEIWCEIYFPRLSCSAATHRGGNWRECHCAFGLLQALRKIPVDHATMILRDRPSSHDSSSLCLSSSYNRVLPQSSMCRARRGLTTNRSSSPSPVLRCSCRLASKMTTDASDVGRKVLQSPDFQISQGEKARNLP